MEYELKFSCYNEHSILIEWPAIMDENMLKDILNFKNIIEKKYIKQKVEVINAFNSILVIYNYAIDNINDEVFRLKALKFTEDDLVDSKSKLWKIPVCYDDEFGMDLNEFSKQKQLSKTEVVKLHSTAIYTIFFIGFLPGFLYLGGLDKKLHLDRKPTPNLNIKKGAVGIGGNQTGIYPQNSPGGWHIIGKTPVDFFNAKSSPPCVFNAGDQLKFYPISKSDFLDLEHDVKHGCFQLKPLQNA